ncbi:hypothetical protein LPJ61_006631 [Coemansia biformis]|uniref:Uncharacterized protein n=1 Tax=Coemansia biformis TaxID=1286918 RepID=A0A9W8CMH4_9FUNG|nr:hypothetical protein LPJ61_006631 [Coemansia biformis]
MDHASLAFAEVVAVLGALPSLQTLRSRVSVLGAEFNGKTIAQVAEIVRSRHAPLNGCFREWHIRNQGRLPMNSVLPYAMILADVCPLLRTVAVRREFGGQLQGAVGRLLACGLYADLARRYRLTVRRMARLSVIGIRQLAPAQAVPGMRRAAAALADG